MLQIKGHRLDLDNVSVCPVEVSAPHLHGVFTSPSSSNFHSLAPTSPPPSLLPTSSITDLNTILLHHLFNCELPPQVFRRSVLKVVERKAKSIFALGVALILMAFSYENLPEFERSGAP